MPTPNEEKPVLDQDENDQPEGTEENAEQPEGEQPPEAAPEEKPAEAPAEKAERPVWTMPVTKAQEEKKRAVEKAREEARNEYEADKQKLVDEYEQKLKAGKPMNSVEAELSQLADKYGLEQEAVTGLLGVFKKSIQLPDFSKYDTILKERELEAHKAQVASDIESRVIPLILKDSPSATAEHIQSVKDKIAELAFSEGYNTYRIEDIYKVNREDLLFKNGMSAETPGGKGQDIVAFKHLSDEDEIALADKDPQTYKRYVRWLEGKSSRYDDVT